MQDNEKLVTPYFKVVPVLNEARTKAEGRPIYDNVEMVEIRIAGDRNFAPTFPAHQLWKKVEGEEVTYAMRWEKQYRLFKEGQTQIADGTPLEELTFLTQAKRMELKALKVYTAEALSMLEGKNLKALGMEGRKLKDQATAYLDRAKGTADTSRMAAEIAELKARLSRFEGAQVPDEDAPEVSTDAGELSDEEIKALIKDRTGQAPRGQPSRETLLRMLDETHEAA